MLNEEEQAEEKEKQIEIEEELSKIIYIKNLSFTSTDASLQKLFESAKIGTIRSVRIVKS